MTTPLDRLVALAAELGDEQQLALAKAYTRASPTGKMEFVRGYFSGPRKQSLEDAAINIQPGTHGFRATMLKAHVRDLKAKKNKTKVHKQLIAVHSAAASAHTSSAGGHYLVSAEKHARVAEKYAALGMHDAAKEHRIYAKNARLRVKAYGRELAASARSIFGFRFRAHQDVLEVPS